MLRAFLLKEKMLENKPETDLRLPAAGQIGAGYKRLLQRGVKLVSGNTIGNTRYRYWLKIAGGGGVFANTPFAADKVAGIYNVQTYFNRFCFFATLKIEILQETHIYLAEPGRLSCIFFCVQTTAAAQVFVLGYKALIGCFLRGGILHNTIHIGKGGKLHFINFTVFGHI